MNETSLMERHGFGAHDSSLSRTRSRTGLLGPRQMLGSMEESHCQRFPNPGFMFDNSQRETTLHVCLKPVFHLRGYVLG